MSDTRQPITSWRDFFNLHAPHYDKNSFTAWTSTEVSFLEDLFMLAKGARILDIGCGTGRHSIELAKRGYVVTGIDISNGMLAQAQAKARGAGVEVEFIEADATQIQFDAVFDAAICLCEGAFGLTDPDKEPVGHDFAILKNVFAALKPGAPFVLNALNGYATIRRVTDEMVQMGAFNPATMHFAYQDEFGPDDDKHLVNVRERMFIPPELVSMLRFVGFEVEHVWGGTAGEWGDRPLKLDEIEAMYVCRKPSTKK
ncbi:MAG: class I SAM-dependent methyltransferase [Fimbriimonadaceae bacterium]|nr:class I SAM-dependent methyltransferase [Fimbriimonadaceae bacterium]